MQMGGGSKDTWVLASAAAGEDQQRHIQEHKPEEFAASPMPLPSRVADNLFWMGRYTERVEAGVRLVRALLPSLSGDLDFGGLVSVDSATHLLGVLGYLPEGFEHLSIGEQRWTLERVLSENIYDPSRMSGIGWNLKNVSRVAWPLKARLSQDTWRLLKELDAALLATRPVNRELRMVAQTALLDRVISIMSAFSGLMMENMTRGPGWTFLQIGRRLERALQMTEWITAAMQQPSEGTLRNLLRIADSSITYRSRYLTTVRPEFVLELLLFDATNPRSLVFQLEALSQHIAELPQEGGRELARQALVSVQSCSPEQLCADQMQALSDLGRQLKGTLCDVSDALTATYFSHSVSSRLVTPY
jgi:uncharacterized alpha-E superfamily protein